MFAIAGDIVERHRAWSIDRFGDRTERGPVGPLKHLSKEALEAAEDPYDITEYADCMFLLLDSLYRAGFTAQELNQAMEMKQAILDMRTYPRGVDGEPSEHVRE